MKPEHKAVIKTAGTFGFLGASILLTAGNPIAWAALAYSTYRIGKAAYQKEQSRATVQDKARDPDLFI